MTDSASRIYWAGWTTAQNDLKLAKKAVDDLEVQLAKHGIDYNDFCNSLQENATHASMVKNCVANVNINYDF